MENFSHKKTNNKVLELMSKENLDNCKIIDVGAGEGYFSNLLGDYIEKQGCNISSILSACDLFPEQYRYDKIECNGVNINKGLPYENKSFDIALSIEVIEHIENQFEYIQELYRISNKAIITTPNILNINSRINYFMSGFWLLFEPLPLFKSEPVHLSGHVNPISYYYLSYMLYKAGFKKIKLHFDRIKKSGLFLSILFYPVIKLFHFLYCKKMKRKYPKIYEENKHILKQISTIKMLSSRTIIIEAM